jgi:hypothetical protein
MSAQPNDMSGYELDHTHSLDQNCESTGSITR